jgi:hypothetical protein
MITNPSPYSMYGARLINLYNVHEHSAFWLLSIFLLLLSMWLQSMFQFPREFLVVAIHFWALIMYTPPQKSGHALC